MRRRRIARHADDRVAERPVVEDAAAAAQHERLLPVRSYAAPKRGASRAPGTCRSCRRCPGGRGRGRWSAAGARARACRSPSMFGPRNARHRICGLRLASGTPRPGADRRAGCSRTVEHRRRSRAPTCRAGSSPPGRACRTAAAGARTARRSRASASAVRPSSCPGCSPRVVVDVVALDVLRACVYELKTPIAAFANPNDVSNGLVPTVSCWKLIVPERGGAVACSAL